MVGLAEAVGGPGCVPSARSFAAASLPKNEACGAGGARVGTLRGAGMNPGL